MDRGFEILPHTADMRIKVWGHTLEELFENALRAAAFYLKPDASSKSKIKRTLKINSVDINSLLVDFLSEAITLSDINNAVFGEVKFEKLGENFLEGELHGVKVDGFDKDIKAVSYHEVDIKKNPETGMYETVLVFDV